MRPKKPSTVIGSSDTPDLEPAVKVDTERSTRYLRDDTVLVPVPVDDTKKTVQP